MKTLYLVGRTFEEPSKDWEVLGIYTTEAGALQRCTQQRDFVGPIPVDSDLPEETATWPSASYPRWTAESA